MIESPFQRYQISLLSYSIEIYFYYLFTMSDNDALADFYAEIASVEKAVQAKVRVSFCYGSREHRIHMKYKCRNMRIFQVLKRK